MGMPICIEILDSQVSLADFRKVFHLFRKIDAQFSPYKKTSEVSRLNCKEIDFSFVSEDMHEILELAEKAKETTDGYFDVFAKGYFDPSGIVKAWAIGKADKFLRELGFANFFINAGGDIQVRGHNQEGKVWTVGIRHPFEHNKIVKRLAIQGGIATSGTYLRGDHIFDPHEKNKRIDEIVSLTVIAPDVLQADLLATAAFAMGRKGINFLAKQKDVEAYMIDREGIATFTSGFVRFTLESSFPPLQNTYA